MDQLQAKAKALDIERNISFIGSIPHISVLAMMKEAKILLHPSAYEGFSTVCMEALYAGAKVISFIRPMDFDIKNWHIAGNEEEMVNAVVNILQDTHTKYEAVLPYTVEGSAEAIINLFEQGEQAIPENYMEMALS
jgi:glycosyltransferase involved in cell wall biosynthesis